MQTIFIAHCDYFLCTLEIINYQCTMSTLHIEFIFSAQVVIHISTWREFTLHIELVLFALLFKCYIDTILDSFFSSEVISRKQRKKEEASAKQP